MNGTWGDGTWMNGTWKGGNKAIGRCKWAVSYNYHLKLIDIGCKTQTVEEWDKFFKSNEVFETPRDTEQFKRIFASYKMAKHAIEVERELVGLSD